MIDDIPIELYASQEDAIDKILKLFNKNINPICALPVGEGKTAITCVIIKHMLSTGNNRIILLVKAANLIDPWKIELDKFDIKYDMVYGKERRNMVFSSKYVLRKNAILLTSIKTATKDIRYILEIGQFDLLIIDEIHTIINPKRYTQASINLAKIDSKRKLFLTATPIQNYQNDLGLINILLNKQKSFVSTQRANFEERSEILEQAYNDAVENNVIIQMNKKTENQSAIFIEPSIIKSMILLSVPIYEEMEKYINENENYFFPSKNKDGKYSQKLEQFLSHPKSIFKNNTKAENYINCGKVTAIKAILSRISSNEKVIIFSRYKDVLFQYSKELRDIGYNTVIFTGEDRYREKIEHFKNDDTINILLTTIFKSAEGINLHEANHVIILEFWWNPQKIFQAIGRIDRRIQKKDIFVYLLCYNKDNDIYKYEKYIFEKMQKKINEAQKVIKLQPELPEIKVFNNELTFEDGLNFFLDDFKYSKKKSYFSINKDNVIDHDEIIRIEEERREKEKIENKEKEKQRSENLINLYKEAFIMSKIGELFRDKRFDDIDFSGQ
jgi:superfamily II DNA or RNA helicase